MSHMSDDDFMECGQAIMANDDDDSTEMAIIDFLEVSEKFFADVETDPYIIDGVEKWDGDGRTTHINMLGAGSDPIYVCVFCERQYLCQQGYNMHMDIHVITVDDDGDGEDGTASDGSDVELICELAGIALLALAVWMYFDTAAYLATDHNDKFFISIYILIGAGSLMTLVGFLGCCGAMQESSCMLGSFSAFVILIFAAEIAGAVYGYSHKDQVKTVISKRVTNMIRNEYSVQTAVTVAVDKMQEKLKCCGATGVNDWAESSFNNRSKLISSLVFRIPESCCIDKGSDQCKAATSATLDTFRSGIHSDGCLAKIEEKVEKHLFTIIIVGISIAVIQIFGFVFSLVLCCAVSSRDY